MVHGDSDRVVPLEENTQIVINRYTKLGGEAAVKVVPGKGHQVGDDFFKSKENFNSYGLYFRKIGKGKIFNFLKIEIIFFSEESNFEDFCI